jgi:hypothetical protein
MLWILLTAMVCVPMTDSGHVQIPIKPLMTQEKRVEDIGDNTQQLFEMIISAEGHPAWDLEGYLLLAQAVKNQLVSGHYGETYREVLIRPYNFSVYASGRYKQVALDDNAVRAVEMVLSGSEYMNYGQLYFCTESHLARNPNGLHGRSNEVARYKNVVFFN